MPVLRRTCVLTAAIAVLAAVAACNHSDPPGPFAVRFVEPSSDPSASYIEVTGVDRSALSNAARRLDPTSSEWQSICRIHVAAADGKVVSDIPVAGKYTVAGEALRFTPLFAFDRGRHYRVTYCGQAGQPDRKSECVEQFLAAGERPQSAPTYVAQIFPSGEVWPENQLRFYIHFSAPMGRRGGIEHIKLLDDRGREVEDPFLPLDAEFWNADRTRYTVFFDPGRQKRGILPNREMGPSLVDGRNYALVVDRTWIDGNGNPLAETFTRRFRVGPPDLAALDTETWTIAVPGSATRDALTVTFPEPLDHGLLARAVGVRRDGQPVVGEVRIDDGEKRWSLVPAEPWQPGRYSLIALSVLEDRAGNRIGRAFEVDNFERVDKVAEPEVTAIPFSLAPPGSASAPSPRHP